MNIDEFIEHTQETARKHRYHADFFDINNPMRVACVKSAEDCEQLAEWLEKSKEYQQLEEQGRLVKLPCKVGDTVYKVNKASRKVTQHKVREVEDGQVAFENYDYRSFNCFGKRLFPTREEAEARLKELRGSNE